MHFSHVAALVAFLAAIASAESAPAPASAPLPPISALRTCRGQHESSDFALSTHYRDYVSFEDGAPCLLQNLGSPVLRTPPPRNGPRLDLVAETSYAGYGYRGDSRPHQEGWGYEGEARDYNHYDQHLPSYPLLQQPPRYPVKPPAPYYPYHQHNEAPDDVWVPQEPKGWQQGGSPGRDGRQYDRYAGALRASAPAAAPAVAPAPAVAAPAPAAPVPATP
ncbi:hypothetical protein BDK51DRAFT_39834, partial [Blyttiomyces helicus]